MAYLGVAISAVMQLLLFSAVPVIWWLIGWRKKTSFWAWIGLTRPKFSAGRGPLGVLLLALALGVAVTVVSLLLVPASEVASYQFARLGLSGVGLALIFAYVQTGLAEEIFFRGFLTKRLTNWLGLTAGNIVQASLFGLLHGALFFAVVNVAAVALIVALTGGLGWVMGLLNERYAGGSIVPSWLFHGTLNMASVFVAMFQV